MARTKATAVPDAWEDDWETAADKMAAAEDSPTEDTEEGGALLSKKARLALHHETNKKIWEEAESPDTFHFIEATSNVPLATTYQPQVKVLSRKPVLAKRPDPNAAAGIANLNLQDDEDDSDDERRKAKETQEERAAREKEALEAKRRAYEEAKKRIFGDDSSSGSGQSPGRSGDNSRGGGRGRGRGRGSGPSRGNDRPRSSGPSGSRELYDPSYLARPGSAGQKREGTPQGRNGGKRNSDQLQASREPRGPDGRGRGFGIGGRGGRGG